MRAVLGLLATIRHPLPASPITKGEGEILPLSPAWERVRQSAEGPRLARVRGSSLRNELRERSSVNCHGAFPSWRLVMRAILGLLATIRHPLPASPITKGEGKHPLRETRVVLPSPLAGEGAPVSRETQDWRG